MVGSSNAGEPSGAVLEGAWALLAAALEEGYGGALRINARDFEAGLGRAEVHFELGKLAGRMQRPEEAGEAVGSQGSESEFTTFSTCRGWHKIHGRRCEYLRCRGRLKELARY